MTRRKLQAKRSTHMRRRPYMSKKKRNTRGRSKKSKKSKKRGGSRQTRLADDLIRAAFEGDQELCRSLIEQGANANAANKNGYTALMYAA